MFAEVGVSERIVEEGDGGIAFCQQAADGEADQKAELLQRAV